MSASESSPLPQDLQESIEQLIAETVRRSKTGHEEELQHLRGALKAALDEVEASQAALERAAATLRTAIAAPADVQPDAAPDAEVDQVVGEAPEPTEAEAAEPEPDGQEQPADVAGPHELDVIAHDVQMDIATGLQTMLRGRPEVKSAQTRQFVNGELRLKLQMESSLDLPTVQEWVAERNGRIGTHTAAVLELQFGS